MTPTTYQVANLNITTGGTYTPTNTNGLVDAYDLMAQTTNTAATTLAQFGTVFTNIAVTDNTYDAPPRRRPPPLPFNRYVNASDLLEEFIAYVGAAGVRQGEVLALPVELFVKWLVIRACEEEQEPSDVTLELPPHRQPRCHGCGRWMPRRDRHLPLHDGRCAARYFARREPVGP